MRLMYLSRANELAAPPDCAHIDVPLCDTNAEIDLTLGWLSFDPVLTHSVLYLYFDGVLPVRHWLFAQHSGVVSLAGGHS
jgi:hypothetical protein